MHEPVIKCSAAGDCGVDVVPPGPPAEVAVPDAFGQPVHPQRRELLLQRAAPLAGTGAGADEARRAGRQRAGEDDLLAVLVDAPLRGPAKEASHLEPVAVRAGVGLADHLQQPGLGLPLAAHEHDLHGLLGRAPLRGGEQASRRAAEGGGRHERQEEGRGSRERRRGAAEEQKRGHGRRRRGRCAGEGTVARPQPQLNGADRVVDRSPQSVAAGGGESASSHGGCAGLDGVGGLARETDGSAN